MLVTAAAMVLAAACKQAKAPPISTAPTMADSAEQVMFDVHSLLTNNGVQRGQLFADTAYIFHDQTLFVFRKARVVFYTTTGEQSGTMRADRGVYDLRSQMLQGFGNVVITTTDGKKLLSPQVQFNQIANQVSSDTTFELIEKDRTQRGIGFSSDPNLLHWTCKRMCGGTAPITIPDR